MSNIIVDEQYDTYECEQCNRGFDSSNALFQHCNNTRLHKWCAECLLTFDTDSDLRGHKFWAPAHTTCDMCSEVFENANNLKVNHSRL